MLVYLANNPGRMISGDGFFEALGPVIAVTGATLSHSIVKLPVLLWPAGDGMSPIVSLCFVLELTGPLRNRVPILRHACRCA